MLSRAALGRGLFTRGFSTGSRALGGVSPPLGAQKAFARSASTDSALSSAPSASSASASAFALANPFTNVPTVYGGFKVHKSKAALDVAFVRPEVSQVRPRSTTAYPYFRLDRAGALRLEFAPSAEGATPQPTGATTRAYQWAHKVAVQLSVAEVGELLAFAAYTSATEVKFFHDPQLGGEGEGEVRKELVVRRNGPGKGYFFNCTMSVKTGANPGKQTVMLPVSDGEFEVLVTLCRQLLPQMLAMHHLPPLLRTDGAQQGEQM